MTVTELLDELGIDYKTHGQSPHVSHGWVGLVCPWCGSGTGKYGLGVHVRSLKVTCWKCGNHGLAEVLKELTGESWRVTRDRIHRLDADDAPTSAVAKRGRFTPPVGLGPLLPAHRNYLTRRGFDPDYLASEWSVGGIGPDAVLQWRLFLPVHRDGHPVSWTTRAVGSRVQARYISASPEEETVPLKSCLYGEDKCRHAVVVTEGPFDAIRIGPGAVALLGLSYTEHQVVRLSRFPLRAICFDSDPVARSRARKLADQLSVFPGETYVVALSGPDPCDSPPDEVEEVRRRFLV